MTEAIGVRSVYVFCVEDPLPFLAPSRAAGQRISPVRLHDFDFVCVLH